VFEENLTRIEQLLRRLVAVMAQHKPLDLGLQAPSHEIFTRATMAYWAEMVNNPAQFLHHQLAFWAQSAQQLAQAQQLLSQGIAPPPEEEETPTDRRFSNPLWRSHPYFNYLRRQYLLNAEALTTAVQGLEGLGAREQQRIEYFTDQIIAMMSPTNFIGTNPDVIEKALKTEGLSLVQGLENLIADLEANDGELVVRLADESAFEIGGNVATTAGKVMFRNRLMELIQYTPTTETVYGAPLVIFPPWINKYYILDLKQSNSMVKWLVDQGFTVFMVSWVNPDRSYADVGMAEYIEEGFLQAIAQVRALCGQSRVNVAGYCIGGTTLHLALALLNKRGDDWVRSASFLTTLTDFSSQGQFTPFLQEDFLDAIDREVEQQGLLRAFIMQRTFSFLRSNDLIYDPAIRSYMMGEPPPAFDLLFWNGDGAGLPGRMVHEYLRLLCQQNLFVSEGVAFCGEHLHIRQITLPVFAIACETDHIACWQDCYRGFQQLRSRSKTFVLSQSGHIAGIVNPPTRDKYGHYVNARLKEPADAWRKSARFGKGSWWPLWKQWLAKRSGRQVPARFAGDSGPPVIEDAPGAYVKMRATR